MNGDKESFLKAIRENWQDDDLRKIYSDWLEENGEPTEAARQRNWPEIREASEKWLQDFIKHADCPDYKTVINAALGQHELNDGGDVYTFSGKDQYGEETWLHFNGNDAHGAIPDEFWQHIEVVYGYRAEGSERSKSFSCSCLG